MKKAAVIITLLISILSFGQKNTPGLTTNTKESYSENSEIKIIYVKPVNQIKNQIPVYINDKLLKWSCYLYSDIKFKTVC